MGSQYAPIRIDRRRDPRYAAQIESHLLWEGDCRQVVITDISCYGALVSGSYLPAVGTWVTIIADHLEVTGTVIWLGADKGGILLSSPIDPLEHLAHRPVRTVNRVTETPMLV